MQDFTGGGIHALPSQRGSWGDPEIDRRIRELVADSGCTQSNELIEQMVISALKMGRDKITPADLKLFNRSLNEMRYAARVFAPFRHKRKVVVFGSARTLPTEPEALEAEEFARKMRDAGYMIITGGGEGIMGAAQRGAGRDASFGLNIRLPFEQRANEVIHGDAKLINFNYFFTRKLNFVKETHAVALFPGGFGTLDEGFEVLTLMQTGKARILPVVLVDKPGGSYWETWFRFMGEYLLKLGLVSAEDFGFFKIAHDVDHAVAEIEHFYRNFRSYRWVGSRMVMRLEKKLTEAAVEQLKTEFHDLLKGNPLVQAGPLPEEQNEPDTLHLPRLIFVPERKNFGRLRKLIDAVNDAETVE
ncbi:MAG: LOG family protein [Verrucomicrobiota bacterium]